ncbi:flagellar hook assembly protein FlgD [Candidatus Acidulodesulfobacterium sp. H_13]|uniref:flagellar hook assembly protein FlgD n=1 Tax=Candidatus Acidulodesulfobacterium sp. H_13 TaxID=3395470 RepID=UPI003AF4136E
MFVNSLLNVATAAAPNLNNSAGSNKLVSENTFMNLMVKELQNQNPLEPMSNTNFISELAQFNSMNQLTSMNSTLKSLVSSQNQAALGSTVSLIGKTVQAKGNSFGFTSGVGMPLKYSLPQNTNSVSLDIYNGSGNLVYNTKLGPRNLGPQSFNWNGLENNGSSAPSGDYSFSVNATDAAGNPLTVTAYSNATVTGLTTSSKGAVELKLSNGSIVPLSSVTSVG